MIVFSHPFWDKVFAFSHPKKLMYMGMQCKNSPQQQQQEEERFPLPDLSAAPQTKKRAM